MDHLINFHIIVFYDDFEPISIYFLNDFDFFTSYFSYIYFTYFLSTFFLFSYILYYFSFSFFLLLFLSFFLPSTSHLKLESFSFFPLLFLSFFLPSTSHLKLECGTNIIISQNSKLYVWVTKFYRNYHKCLGVANRNNFL